MFMCEKIYTNFISGPFESHTESLTFYNKVGSNFLITFFSVRSKLFGILDQHLVNLKPNSELQ